jgi:hypothetical protein
VLIEISSCLTGRELLNTLEGRMSAQPTQPSLYERLGGIYSIATVVDDLIDRVMNDPRLNANPS